MDAVKQAVLATFTMICGVEPSCETDMKEEVCHDGMVGIISFVGDHSWCLMLGLPRETTTRLAIAFAGFEIPMDSVDMGDVIGELANVLAGHVSARLEDAGLIAQMSLPTVARGQNVELLLPHALPTRRMPFLSAQGEFWVKVLMARSH